VSNAGWIGVDLDGTLAHYDGWIDATHIGDPIPEMLERVKRWLAEGREVRIFTARVSCRDQEELRIVREAILGWLVDKAGLPQLAITCLKDYAMVELWDDRAVQVEANTGRPVGYSTRGLA
jgi:hypothetical protein